MNCAVIIIDSGFAAEALSGADRVLGVCDLYDGKTEVGAPFLSTDALRAFAGDTMNHGSIVLGKVRQLAPEAPLVLIRAYPPNGRLIRTGWSGGRRTSPGWTEAYLWAVKLSADAGFPSVANCSFGGFTHAMDGTGWESFQIGSVSGPGKSGHVVVAAAGPGDGRAVHAGWNVLPGETVGLPAIQSETTEYNFWCGAAECVDWELEVRKDGQREFSAHASSVPSNLWNGRRQQTFTVHGSGAVQLIVRRAESNDPRPARFDCWVTGGDGATFTRHVDPVLIAEPAVFPQVISVGLRKNSYSPFQHLPGHKPDVLLEGAGAISFRAPAVTVLAARLLAQNSTLDSAQVLALIGKHPAV